MSALQTTLASAAAHLNSPNGDLVKVIVNSRSNAEATLAATILRHRIPDLELVMLFNLRELMSELPSEPFRVPHELDVLGRILGYEPTGTSWCKVFETQGSRTVLEFAGNGNRIASIWMHHGRLKAALAGADTDFIGGRAIEVFVSNAGLGEGLVEALRTLGHDLAPRFYFSVEDYMVENAVATLDDIRAIF